MEFALSTSWNAFRYESGKELLFEIEQAGFSQIELSFNLTAKMVAEIETVCAESSLKVASLHNYCPIPDGLTRQVALPDVYSLSSSDEEQRSRALRYTKLTIDTAQRLKAKTVVLHCGRIEIPDKTRELISLYQRKDAGLAEFNALKDNIISERQSLAQAYLTNVLRSLEDLNRYAQQKNIMLGIENRFYFREIPSLEETQVILDTFKGSNIFYWHDTGHAQVMENLGFCQHKDFLEVGGSRLIGVHLHDAVGCDDHQAPAKDGIDFSLLVPYLKPDTLKVIEAHSPVTSLELSQAREYLSRVFNEQY